jgi:hypothetical protein
MEPLFAAAHDTLAVIPPIPENILISEANARVVEWIKELNNYYNSLYYS